MKKLFKNITNTAKTAAINCQTSIAAFHRRAVCGNAGEGYIDTAVKVLIPSRMMSRRATLLRQKMRRVERQ